MKRLLATCLSALSLSVAVAGAVAGPAAAVPPPPETSCKGLSITVGASTLSLTKCSDKKATDKGGIISATGPGVNVITWDSGTTTTLDVASTIPVPLPPNACPSGQTGLSVADPVTASDTPGITVGMTFRASFCIEFDSSGEFAVSVALVPHTDATIS